MLKKFKIYADYTFDLGLATLARIYQNRLKLDFAPAERNFGVMNN